MYRMSIWLKGGGKIIEECELDDNEIKNIYKEVNEKMGLKTNYMLNFKRNPIDDFPILVDSNEIAAIQIDKDKKKEFHGRRLETNY